MSLVTRCPTCATTFRVLPAQLSARAGRVRCGQCSAVFDGVSNLLTEEAVAALPSEPSPQLGLFEGREPEESSPAAVPDPVLSPTESPVPTGMPRHAPSMDAEPADNAKIVVPAFLEPEPPAAGHLVVWTLLAFVALCALLVQAGLHFRTELAVLVPQARPYLETACEVLGCELRLPRRVELLSIESSDLQADSQRPGAIVLNALLRNRAPFAQEFPDLELTLTDQNERAVIRKVLRPRDYLQERRSQPFSQGMGGGAEEAVRIFLDTGGILATGYQLFLFYPCPPPPSSLYWQMSYPSRCQDSGAK